MAEQRPAADTAAIRQDLEYMTARWHELSAPAVFEVRAFKEGAQPQTARFKPEWMDDAVDWIANLNALGFNTYAVRNPIRADITGSAKDEDIIGAFFLWADCDDPTAAGNVYRFAGPKWSAAVTTGRTPSVRVHTYWMLDEPCTDLAEWRRVQEDIASHFGSDRSVVNPSRIMRIGGTINHPFKRKQERGYIPELCTINTTYDEPRAPVTFEQMRRAFGPKPEPDRIQTASAPPAGLQIDLGHKGKSVDELMALVKGAGTDGQKHASVRDLAGHLAGTGVKRETCEAIIRTVCPVWDRNVESLINEAYQWASAQGIGSSPEAEAFEAAGPKSWRDYFKPWGQKNLSAIPYPEFVYSDFYARGYTSLTLAAPKVGKSMLGLAESMDMATGRGILTGIKRDPLTVVYFNAEDDQNTLDARVSALLTHYGIPQAEIAKTLWPVSGVPFDDFIMVAGQDGAINEPLFQMLEDFCKEVGADVLIFDPLQDLSASPETNEVFRILGRRLRKLASSCNVSLGLIHHTRKVAPGMQATIDDGRGGSALRGTARFNRILNLMTEDEAIKAGLENHHFYFRIGDIESNLAPPSSDVNRWFEKVSVDCPNGQNVGAIKPWKWPDAFDGISQEQARQCQRALMQQDPKCSASVQASNWGGHVIGEVLNIDTADKAGKARVNAIVKTWVQTGVLAIEHVFSKRDGRDKPVLVAGTNDLGVS